MKKTFLLKTMLLLCALIVGSTSAWAVDDVTVTWNINGVVTPQTTAGGCQVNTALKTSSITPNGATGTWTAVSNTATSYAGSSSGAQLGAGKSNGTNREFNGTITLSNTSIPANATIKKITVTATSNGSSTLTATVGGSAFGTSQTISGTTATDYTLQGSLTGNAIILTLSNTTTANYVNISKIVVVYTPSTEITHVTGVSLNKTETSLFVGESEKLTATIAPNYATNQNVSWESDNESVATVDDKGNVTAEAAGTANITVTTQDGDYTATCAVTVEPVPPVVVTLDFTDDDWGFPSEYDKTEKTYTNGGYTITLGASSTGHKVLTSGSGDNLTINGLIFGKSGATLTLPAFGFNVKKIKVYGISTAGANVTFNVYVVNDAVSTEVTSSKVTHDFKIATDKRDVGKIYTIKVTNANNCQISKIEICGNGCGAGLVTSAGWATYITTSDVEYPANTAYVVTDASVSAGLTLAEVTQVPANTPLLLKGAGAKTAISLESAPAAPTNNLLSVCNGPIASGSNAYVLAKDGEGACFKQWTGDASVLNGRVVLILSASTRSTYELGEEMTGVQSVVREAINDNQYYNLSGQRVDNPTKGLYIVNGKKVVIK